MKTPITESNLEDALMWPEDYDWGGDETQARPTQGGGTAMWHAGQQNYVFVTPPEWWDDCKPGDPVPREWGIL